MPNWGKLETIVRWALIPPALYYACSYFLGLLWFGDPTWRGLLLAVSLTSAATVMDEALTVNGPLRILCAVVALAGLTALALPGAYHGADRALALPVMVLCLVHFMFRICRFGWRGRSAARRSA